jgi:hypothetical protein
LKVLNLNKWNEQNTGEREKVRIKYCQTNNLGLQSGNIRKVNLSLRKQERRYEKTAGNKLWQLIA